MDFQEAVKGLRSEEIEALKVLEASGWQIGLDVRVEDMTKPDGQRRRTFSNRGRYAVAVILKNLGGRDRVEFPAFTPDLNQGIEAAAFVQVVEAVEPMAGEISLGDAVEVNPVVPKTPLAWSGPDEEEPKKAKPKGRGRR